MADLDCCGGYEDCDCGVALDGTPMVHGECHDCHCMRESCDECGEWLNG